jgi:hypothetical protein
VTTTSALRSPDSFSLARPLLGAGWWQHLSVLAWAWFERSGACPSSAAMHTPATMPVRRRGRRLYRALFSVRIATTVTDAPQNVDRFTIGDSNKMDEVDDMGTRPFVRSLVGTTFQLCSARTLAAQVEDAEVWTLTLVFPELYQ